MGLRIQKKRRRQGKTDYKLRLGLLKSDARRIAIRRTNKYIIIQEIETDEAKDRVISGVTSKELTKHGWDEKFAGSLKSIPAAYLAGLLAAKKIKGKKFILDIGLAINKSGNRIYSAAKGLIDGGIKFEINEKVFPIKEVLEGKNLKPEAREIIKKVKEEIQNG